MNMPWTTYSKLSAPLRREYDYRFKEYKKFNAVSLLTVVAGVGFMALLLLFTMYVIVTNEVFNSIKMDVIEITQLILRLIQIGGWTVFAIVTYDAVIMLIEFFMYRYWLHKNNIKIERAFPVWIKKWLEYLK